MGQSNLFRFLNPPQIDYAYAAGNPVMHIDPFGLDLTPAQQAAVVAAAQDWSQAGVKYVFGGASKTGADCSGSVSGIYKQAGIDIGRMTSGAFKNSPLFTPVQGPPQVGDVGVYPGHVDIYGGADTGVPGDDVWSASHTGGPVFGPAQSGWYGTPSWYRYNGPN
jgi:cell wall-associated NlpC family hydrolase